MKSLAGMDGVISVEAHVKGGEVIVEYDDSRVELSVIEAELGKTGYPVRGGRAAGTALALGIGLLLVAAYLVAGASGAFSSIPAIDARVGYAMLFGIGALTSIHCVAMCGGIALSQSVKPTSGERLRQMQPGLLYNAGRVVSYTAIGALVGALGAAVSFTPFAKGAIAAIAGAFMVVLGLRMLGLLRTVPGNLFVWLFSRLKIGSRLRSSDRLQSNRGPFVVGLLNGLMPCGPLQAMQLYALGTGSAAAGALSMFAFSLGTVPLMLIFGLTATLLPRKFVPVMIKASSVLVMFLGVVTFARAATLAGVALPSLPVRPGSAIVAPVSTGLSSGGSAVNAGLIKATVSGGRQTVLTEFKNGQYVPFAVQAGLPLTWTVRIAEEDITGCNNELVVPAYNIRKKLAPGDNVIEFTPTKAGRISYSCWMGMIRSSITVTESIGNPSSFTDLPDGPLDLPSGGGCCAIR
jgi:sulfite exporter TauE/SafE